MREIAVDKDEKRRLKKLGKQIVADQSRELDERLRQANPAPIGSNEWARNYREGTAKEKALQAAPPDRLSSAELQADFVTNPKHQDLPAELFGVPGYFWECRGCGDVVNTVPSATAQCTCGNVLIDMSAGRRQFRKPENVRLVSLIGKAAKAVPRKRPWWKFWG
jgi:hypothetical protein